VPEEVQGRSVVAGALALAGGVAALVGSFLGWAEITAGPFSEQARGIDGWEGKATIIGGVVMLVAGIRVVAGSHQAIARLRPSAAIGGSVVAGVGIYTALTVRDQLLDAAAMQLPRDEVESALDTGLLELSIGVGLYLVIAGGAQGILAAVVAMGARDEAPAPSGAGLRGWSSGPGGSPGGSATPPRPAVTDIPPPPGHAPNEGGGPSG
jgi:hypothetical protein